MSLIRLLGLYASYWYYKIRYHRHVRFNGFTVVYAFPGSSIEFVPSRPGTDDEPTVINSHWTVRFSWHATADASALVAAVVSRAAQSMP